MKKIVLFIVLFFSITVTYAQSFMHGAGVGIFVVKTPSASADASFSLSYSPRFNFLETDALSLSIGIPINVGISGGYSIEYNSYYGGYEENTLRAFVNAPAMLNLNVGAGSTKENEKRFGFFAGAGFGLHYGYVTTIDTDGYSYSTMETRYRSLFGPAGNAGVRIAVGSHQKNIEIRLSYMKTAKESKVSVYGVNTYFNF